VRDQFRQAAINTRPAGEPAFGLPKLTQHLALRNATSARIELRYPIFGHLSNIAQRERARKEIVIAGGASGWSFRPKRNSRKAILTFSHLNS
jgi:hypothetical protein